MRMRDSREKSKVLSVHMARVVERDLSDCWSIIQMDKSRPSDRNQNEDQPLGTVLAMGAFDGCLTAIAHMARKQGSGLYVTFG